MKSFNLLLKNKRKKVLLCVFPHPDDETVMSGGLLLTAKKFGWQTNVLCLTKGGEGRLHIHPKGRTVKEVREGELKRAAGILGVDNLYLSNYPDSKLRFVERDWVPFLKKKIKEINPSVVVTYDHSGMYGHPDHIIVSVWVKRIISKMPKHRRPDVFWVSMDEKVKQKYFPKFLFPNSSCPDYILEFSWSGFLKKITAIYFHRSQKLLTKRKMLIFLKIGRKEWYHKVSFGRRYTWDCGDANYDKI